MKNFLQLLLLTTSFFLFQKNGYGQSIEKPDFRYINFNDNWHFKIDSNLKAEPADFDDKSWRILDLPHDWSIEDINYNIKVEDIGPFSKSSPGGPATGFTIGGEAWYRKHFVVNASSDKIVTIHFDGICMESDVWVNGKQIGYHPNGYTPFYYNITPYLNQSSMQNVIAIRVKNKGKNSRWYSGSGIYRSVQLKVSNKIFIPSGGVFCTTTLLSKDSAKLRMMVQVNNQSLNQASIKLKVVFYDTKGKFVLAKIFPAELKVNEVTQFNKNILLPKPDSWSPQSPSLYKTVIQIINGDKVIDEYTENIGIRSIEFSATKGFLLNGEMLKLKGACIHHDNGILGSAAFGAAEERKIQLLKNNGFNAIRTSHNPPSEKFLEACDRLGMLVIDEAFDVWQRSKNKEDYHLFFDDWWKSDLSAMIVRDRNHPSVIMWSIGNEISERADSSGLRLARGMIELIHTIDPTRPITQGVNSFWDHPKKIWRDADSTFSLLDIGGYNYQWKEYENDHALFPDRIMVGTESLAMLANENWEEVKSKPYVIGDFVWTGFDYIGETGLANSFNSATDEKMKWWLGWPNFNSWCGDLDLIGNKKPQSFYRDVVWERSPVEIAVHQPIPTGHHEIISLWGWPAEMQSWNWKGHENDTMDVSIYSRGSTAQLFLNGKLMGQKVINDSTLTARFKVPYQPGELKAIVCKKSKPIATKVLKTSGIAQRLLAVPEKLKIHADRGELIYVNIAVTDDRNMIVPDAALPLNFLIEGPAVLQAAGNGSPDEMTSFRDTQCNTFNGRALLILRSTGKRGIIKVHVQSNGFPARTVTINAE